MVGIAHGEIIKATSMFSELQTGYRPKTKCSNPIALFPEYCKSIRLSSEFLGDLENLGWEILEKDPELLEQYPQTVAVGILKYFLTIHGIEINIDHFSKKLRLSQATINTMYKRIAELDNKV
jgi:hypothetical protein